MELLSCQSPQEGDAWDSFLLDCPDASYWQLHGWLSSYRPMGLQCGIMIKRQAGRITAGAAFLSFKLPLGFGRIVILPHGPVCAISNGSDADELLEALGDHFRKMGAIYVQAWPHVEQGDERSMECYLRAGYTHPRLFGAHEFSSTLLAVDLANRSEEQLLLESRRNTRYYGRASKTTGLELRLGRSQEDLTKCYEVWTENGEYHGFSPRPLASYRIVMERLVMRDQGILLQAWKGDEVAGAIMVLFVGQSAVYAAGAIRRAFASLHPAEFLHLAAMQAARERGLLSYDFNNWGSPGTAQFKRGFRPVEHKWAEPRSLVLRPTSARLIRWGEAHARSIVRNVARLRAAKAR